MSDAISPSWDPALYLSFGDDRTRAARDLLARVAADRPARILDVGCGPGNSTALLAARWPGAAITGLDSSPDMLAAARKSGVAAAWIDADMEHFEPPSAYDLIFANASLQWAHAPADTAARLFAALAPNGWIAVQIPRNFAAPSHTLVRDIAGTGPWADRLAGVRGYDPGLSATPADWARALRLPGHLDIWTTEYVHVLSGADPVFAWMSGTGLRPYLDRLEGEMRSGFETAIRQAFRAAYPPEADGRTLFPFRRLFVVAMRD